VPSPTRYVRFRASADDSSARRAGRSRHRHRFREPTAHFSRSTPSGVVTPRRKRSSGRGYLLATATAVTRFWRCRGSHGGAVAAGVVERDGDGHVEDGSPAAARSLTIAAPEPYRGSPGPSRGHSREDGALAAVRNGPALRERSRASGRSPGGAKEEVGLAAHGRVERSIEDSG